MEILVLLFCTALNVSVDDLLLPGCERESELMTGDYQVVSGLLVFKYTNTRIWILIQSCKLDPGQI